MVEQVYKTRVNTPKASKKPDAKNVTLRLPFQILHLLRSNEAKGPARTSGTK